MNNISIIGRLGHDVELRYTADEKAVGRFSVGVGRGKDRNGNDRGVDWFECVSFGNQAETINKFFAKGSQIGIVGHVQTGSYEDREGVKRKTFDVVVDRFDFVGSKEKKEPEASQQVEGFRAADDDIPF